MRVRSILPLLAVGLLAIAAAPASDEAGSSEAETVQRGCGEPASHQYDPPEGAGLEECKDPQTGLHDDSRTYTATHYTNEVTCGDDHQLVPGTEAAGVRVSGDMEGNAGFLQTCSDGDLPVHGRVTFRGDGDAQDASLTADGDNSNEPEQLDGWATVDAGEQSVTCGQAYSEGGRADANNPTGDDGQDQCG